jgi:hypothetical protein
MKKALCILTLTLVLTYVTPARADVQPAFLRAGVEVCRPDTQRGQNCDPWDVLRDRLIPQMAATYTTVRIFLSRRMCNGCPVNPYDTTPHTIRLEVTWLPYAADATPRLGVSMRLLTFTLRGLRQWRLSDLAPLRTSTVYSFNISVDGWSSSSAQIGVGGA